MTTKVERKEIAERVAGNIVRMLHNGSTPMESLYKFKGDREVLDSDPEITIGRLDLETMRIVAQVIEHVQNHSSSVVVVRCFANSLRFLVWRFCRNSTSCSLLLILLRKNRTTITIATMSTTSINHST